MLKYDKYHLKKQLTFRFIKTTQQLPQSILTECVFVINSNRHKGGEKHQAGVTRKGTWLK